MKRTKTHNAALCWIKAILIHEHTAGGWEKEKIKEDNTKKRRLWSGTKLNTHTHTHAPHACCCCLVANAEGTLLVSTRIYRKIKVVLCCSNVHFAGGNKASAVNVVSM